jgi:beta-lactamase superfamily II metal-dependent hydrolase
MMKILDLSLSILQTFIFIDMADLEVNVSMYPVGELGDCFLLEFAEGDARSSVLIDCGSFRNSEASKARMSSIVKHIQQKHLHDNGKRPIDVVVGTHQHNDHFSGFAHCKDIFSEIGIKNVWLSWLDKPDDAHAQRIANGERKLIKKLTDISLQLSSIKGLKGGQTLSRINEVLGFYGIDESNARAKAPVIPQMGLENLRSIAENCAYLYPKQVVDLPGFAKDEVKVYVLGPPEDNSMLFKIQPGHGESYEEHLTVALNTADGFLSALTNFTDADSGDEPCFPFYENHKKSLNDQAFLASSYITSKEKWRKIDDDWLEQAERLALYLDSYTNNSSVVLAFELVKAQKVLLFVGDAQTGSWLSWKSLDFGQENMQIGEILRNTVLYKVGHHCSHNATLPDCLEKMLHKELVAMIPVDISDPNITKKNGWKMPAAKLYQRIKEVTNGRVLRMDGRYESDCAVDGLVGEKNWGELHKNLSFESIEGIAPKMVTYKIS